MTVNSSRRYGLLRALRGLRVGHTAFSTDFPFAPTAETIEAVNSLRLARDDLDALCSGNVGQIMNISA